MSRKINFGDFEEDEQESTEETQNSKLENQDVSLEIETKDLEIDRLTTAIDNLQTKLEVQASEFREEKHQLQVIIDNHSYQLNLKDQDITAYQNVIVKHKTQIESLSNELHELKKDTGVKSEKLPSGLKTKLNEKVIEDMKDYALSLADDKQNFYKQIAEKFGVSVGSAYNYTRDIYEAKFKQEDSND